MASTTLTVLAQRAAAAADMEDNFISAETWRNWANVENRNLAIKLAGWGFPWKQTDENITLTGASQYEITEPLAIIAVFYVESDGSYTRLRVVNPAQRQGSPNRLVGVPREATIFRNTNDDLSFRFYPNPTSGTVISRQIDIPAELVYSGPTASQSTTVTYPLNWEELIVLRMARRALAKEETVNPFIEVQIAEMDAAIRDACANFLLSDAPVIRNVRDDNSSVYVDSSEWIIV
jgi:hypothetical protein